MIRSLTTRLAPAFALACALALPAAAQTTAIDVLREAGARAQAAGPDVRSLTISLDMHGERRVVHAERGKGGWALYATPVAEDAAMPDMAFIDNFTIIATTLTAEELETEFAGVTLEPGGEMAGRPVFRVRLPAEIAGGVQMDLSMDRETYRILGADLSGTTEEDGPLNMAIELQDYRLVQGFPVAHRRVVRLDDFMAMAGLDRSELEPMMAELRALVDLFPAGEGAAERESVRILEEALATGSVTFIATVADVAVNGPRPKGLVPAS